MGRLRDILFPIILVMQVFFNFTSAGVVIVPKCPEIKPIENFNVTAYSGTWHDLARYPLQMEELKFISYNIKSEDGKWIVEELDDPQNPNPRKMVSRIHLDPDNKGILLQNLSYGDPPTIKANIKEYILSVDYSKYYISYVCLFVEETKTFNEYSTIAVRSEKPDEDVKSAINNFIKSSNILHADNYEWNSKSS